MEKLVIIDFGSQVTQLIARKVRECGTYCEIYPYNNVPALDDSCKAVIFSGSPFSVKQEKAPKVDQSLYLDNFPVLGICYGAQSLAHFNGGTVEKSEHREYGKAALKIIQQDPIFSDIETDAQIWMSHADTITELPEKAEIIANSDGIEVAAFRFTAYKYPVYGLQFHPEVYHSLPGKDIINNFLDIVGCKKDWTPASFVDSTVTELKEKLGDDKVILGLSGGVDSSVAAGLIHRAIGDNLHCIFVDNGLLRKDEFNQVLDSYKGLGFNVKGVDAQVKFLDALSGISDPEEKRKAIGRVFVEVFEEESKKVENARWLGQGTIYPDVIESVSVHGPSAKIKSHHNVGGLPERMNLKIVEPLRKLFKDEVREVGKELDLPGFIVNRHPFPGPGLAIRILGEITSEKVQLVQDADAIFINNLKSEGHYDNVWQAGVILLPVHSVGVMGDERTYEQVVALRAVNSTDGMTAEWSRLPFDFLANVSTQIINQVKGINRVVYDISTKPPATIEWE